MAYQGSRHHWPRDAFCASLNVELVHLHGQEQWTLLSILTYCVVIIFPKVMNSLCNVIFGAHFTAYWENLSPASWRLGARMFRQYYQALPLPSWHVCQVNKSTWHGSPQNEQWNYINHGTTYSFQVWNWVVDSGQHLNYNYRNPPFVWVIPYWW